MSANDFEYYERDGKRYDRVSSILDYFASPQLVDWKVRVGKRAAGTVSREALRIGSNVDEAIRASVRGAKPLKLKTVDAENCYKAFESWKQESLASPHTLKEVSTLYSDELMVAGTPDLMYSDNYIIDVKCAASIKPSYWLQTEFYARTAGVPFKAILRLHKGLAIYEFKSLPVNDEHWQAVCAAVKLYRYYKSASDSGKEVNNESDSTTD